MKMTRRNFLGSSALASAPFFIGCSSTPRYAPVRRLGPNDTVNVAIIGCGLIAKGTNVPGFLQDPRCRVVVACDMVELSPPYDPSGCSTATALKLLREMLLGLEKPYIQ